MLVPIEVPSAKKVTVPVGVTVPGTVGETTAVKVTGWPATLGLGDAETEVVVLVLFTVWVSGGLLLLPLKLPSPS
jgi:hypothetical protein